MKLNPSFTFMSNIKTYLGMWQRQIIMGTRLPWDIRYKVRYTYKSRMNMLDSNCKKSMSFYISLIILQYVMNGWLITI